MRQCKGTESLLADCPHSSVHDCGEGEGAGVVCQQAGEDYQDNCLEYDISYRHTANTELGQGEAHSPEECQAKCINSTDCDHFTFNPNSTRYKLYLGLYKSIYSSTLIVTLTGFFFPPLMFNVYLIV